MEAVTINFPRLVQKKGLTWDVLIVDEAHEGVVTYKTDTAFNHIRRKWTLHLSGTPFKALAKKLKLHPVFKDYEVVLAAGDGKLDDDDENEKSFDRVTKAIAEHDKTIMLSVGQLTTGVTIPEWTAVLMLSNMASPALYMQPDGEVL